MKQPKKYWYLHCTYVDMCGMQHNLKYKLPMDFQNNVAVVFGRKNGCPNPSIKYEEE